MDNFIFLLILLGLLILLLIDRIKIKKLKKNATEVDKLDFVMRPPSWKRTLGLIWIAIGIFIIVMAIRHNLLIFALITLGFTVLGVQPLRKKIVVQGNTIVLHSVFKKDELIFDDISEVVIDQNSYTEMIFDNDIAEVMRGRYAEVSCYNIHGQAELKFTSDWFFFHLMMQRLFDLGILPLLYTKNNKKDRRNLIKLMDFFIDNDLTTWYSFNKKEAAKIGFKLYKDDLTDEGKHLFTSGAVLKWTEFAYQGGDVSDFSLLKNALAEYEKLKKDIEKVSIYENGHIEANGSGVTIDSSANSDSTSSPSITSDSTSSVESDSSAISS